MARRVAAPKVEVPAEPVVEETVAPVESPAAESNAAPEAVASTEAVPAENAEATEKVKAAPKPVDLTKFNEAVKVALEARDRTTGVIDLANTSEVVKAYRELDSAKAKNKAKNVLSEGMRSAVNESDINLAQATMFLNNAIVAAPSGSTGTSTSSTPKAPVDPTEAFVEKAVRIQLAAILHSRSKGEGVADDWNEKVSVKVSELEPQLDQWTAYLKANADATDEENKPAEPEGIDESVKAAFRLSTGRAATPRKAASKSAPAGDGVRRLIGNHITEAFADKAVGDFMTIAELRSFKSNEYGDVQPSAGAITARLFPTDANGTVKPTTVPGVEGAVNAEGNKGARKVAAKVESDAA